MRGWLIPLAGALLLGLAAAASAQEETEAAPEAAAAEAEPSAEEAAPAEESAAEAAPEEEAGPGAFERYGNTVGNRLVAGLNAMITAPADPIALAISPTDDMRSMYGGVVTAPLTGFFAGTAQGLYRFITGALDVAFSPFGIFSTFSPEPRFKALPGWEYEG